MAAVFRGARHVVRLQFDAHPSLERLPLPMIYRRLSFVSALTLAACSSSSGGFDANNDKVADGLGSLVDSDGDGFADSIDIDGDGLPDGLGIDTNGDGMVDGLLLDTDCDGIYESVSKNKDKTPEYMIQPPGPTPGCGPTGSGGSAPGSGGGGSPQVGGSPPVGGSGPSVGGAPSAGGTPAAGGMPAAGGAQTGSGGAAFVEGGLGASPSYIGSGKTTDRYAEEEVYRNGTPYRFIANGWGTNWGSHSISWRGTSFIVESLTGSQGSDYSPAGYPTMFCGLYSEKQVDGCGLPASISSLQTIKTGWAWSGPSSGQYNAAWDIWIGDGGQLKSYLMVWLRDPPGQQPAGAAAAANVQVPNVPGTWSVWTGNVNNRPIVNYVKPEGQDLSELEFDVMDFYEHAKSRNYNLPGGQIMAVAIGFEVWNGPVSNIETKDFYVHVNK